MTRLGFPVKESTSTRIYAMLRNVKEHQLSAVVGRNCKRLRTDADVKQDELAKHARSVGLRWTASKVRDFEAGRNAPKIGRAHV